MPKPSESTFVGKIVKDPKKHVATLLLTGFVGRSSEKDHTRLYFDEQLSQYVEIPDQAILHSEPIPKEQSPLGGVYVWIDRDAQLVQGPAGTDRVKAKFFEGPIVQGFGALPAGPPLNAWTGYPWCGGNFTQDWRCPTAACPIQTLACPTLSYRACATQTGPACFHETTAGCPTHQVGCQQPIIATLSYRACATQTGPGCFYQTTAGCPTQQVLCPQPIPKTLAGPDCVTHIWPYC